MEGKQETVVQELDLHLIDGPAKGVRMEIDDEYIGELAASIAAEGVLQPIRVRPVGERYEVVFGDCRYLACKRLGLATIPAIVKEMSLKETAIARGIENLRRKDLTPIEEAAVYDDLKESHGMDEEAIAHMMGVSFSLVKSRLDLLHMPPQLQQALHAGKISIAVARALWPIDEEKYLEYYLEFAVNGGATADMASQWCKDWKDAQRRRMSGSEDDGRVPAPEEPRPHYVTCDRCQGPVRIEDMRQAMLCPACDIYLRQK
ncbi:Nucleoid occlusion protein [subsurface metagenome]